MVVGSIRSSTLRNFSGSRSMYVTNQPFSVSSTSHLPVRPRYITKSVSVSHTVAFMWKCCLSEMKSLYIWLAFWRCERAFRLMISIMPSSNSLENSSMNFCEFSENIAICR